MLEWNPRLVLLILALAALALMLGGVHHHLHPVNYGW